MQHTAECQVCAAACAGRKGWAGCDPKLARRGFESHWAQKPGRRRVGSAGGSAEFAPRNSPLGRPGIFLGSSYSSHAIQTRSSHVQRWRILRGRVVPAAYASWFCTEKPHLMVHWADNYYTVVRTRIISANVTESRMNTSVNTPARKTNNQALSQHDRGSKPVFPCTCVTQPMRQTQDLPRMYFVMPHPLK